MSQRSAHGLTTPRADDWRDQANCRGHEDAMFPSSNTYEIEQAKGLCRYCPSVQSCLQWALETGEEHGVWGGLTEAERRKIRRRTAQPISVDDYTGTPSPAAQCRSLEEVWEDGTEADGEHLMWTGRKAVHRPRGQAQITPNRLSFYLDRGHWPQGDVKRTCGVDGCVRPAHLNDRRERAEEADLAVMA